MYSDGSIGVEGLTKKDSHKLMSDYDKGIAETTAKTLHDQHQALEMHASERAERLGSFLTTFGDAIDEMKGGFEKYALDKTGWGGHDVEMFQAKKSAEIAPSQSDEAKKWNWKGLSSLGDENFWMSQIGGQMPLLGGIAAIGALTKGVGLPEIIQYLGAAGLMDAQNSLGVYNDTVNGYDKFGNKLTEYDASHAAAKNFKESFPLDLGFMFANMGILGRASVIKPTLGKAVLGIAKGAAVGSVPMVWQGYLAYANEQEAQGKQPDMWDYAQDGQFANTLINGLILGGVLGTGHMITGGYAKQTENWKRLVMNSEGEFKAHAMFNNSLQHEMSGKGDALRDALKLHLATSELSDEEKENFKNALYYSTQLDRNIKGAGIDIGELSGAYQAHNLALADLHDKWSEDNKGNKNLSKIYSDQAKDFRENAKNAMEGNAKYHYVMDQDGKPIFLSEQSFKVLDQEGSLKKWMKSGMIKGVYSSSEPGFFDQYMSKVFPPKEEKPKQEGSDTEQVVSTLKAFKDKMADGAFNMAIKQHMEHPEQHEDLVQMIVDQYADEGSRGGLKKALGTELFNELEPTLKRIVKSQEKTETKELGGKETKLLEEAKPEEVKKVLNQPITDEQGETKIPVPKRNAKTGEVETEDRPAKEVISRLKARHNKITELINCLGAA